MKIIWKWTTYHRVLNTRVSSSESEQYHMTYRSVHLVTLSFVLEVDASSPAERKWMTRSLRWDFRLTMMHPEERGCQFPVFRLQRLTTNHRCSIKYLKPVVDSKRQLWTILKDDRRDDGHFCLSVYSVCFDFVGQ